MEKQYLSYGKKYLKFASQKDKVGCQKDVSPFSFKEWSPIQQGKRNRPINVEGAPHPLAIYVNIINYIWVTSIYVYAYTYIYIYNNHFHQQYWMRSKLFMVAFFPCPYLQASFSVWGRGRRTHVWLSMHGTPPKLWSSLLIKLPPLCWVHFFKGGKQHVQSHSFYGDVWKVDRMSFMMCLSYIYIHIFRWVACKPSMYMYPILINKCFSFLNCFSMGVIGLLKEIQWMEPLLYEYEYEFLKCFVFYKKSKEIKSQWAINNVRDGCFGK